VTRSLALTIGIPTTGSHQPQLCSSFLLNDSIMSPSARESKLKRRRTAAMAPPAYTLTFVVGILTILCSWKAFQTTVSAFSPLNPHAQKIQLANLQYQPSSTVLHMSSLEKVKTTKKTVQVLDRTETKPEEDKKKEQMWRVVLHNDEVHTFNYVVRSLCKVVGTLDRKAAFEICVETHGIGKATVTKTWKKQAEGFCLNLQRQGLTVSISPDSDFEGGHSGGGI
jgi:ATP-dependent Clp protease adapter protein ClpS